jgi:hypothetical protein
MKIRYLLSLLCLVILVFQRAGAENGTNRTYIGEQFELAGGFEKSFPECLNTGEHFSFHNYRYQHQILYVTENMCGSVRQLWLLGSLDKDGHTLTAEDVDRLAEHLKQTEEVPKEKFVVEDVFIVPPLKRNQDIFPADMCNDSADPKAEEFLFAIGTSVPIYNGKTVIGARGKQFTEAWKIDFKRHKFKQAAVAGIKCEFWE